MLISGKGSQRHKKGVAGSKATTRTLCLQQTLCPHCCRRTRYECVSFEHSGTTPMLSRTKCLECRRVRVEEGLHDINGHSPRGYDESSRPAGQCQRLDCDTTKSLSAKLQWGRQADSQPSGAACTATAATARRVAVLNCIVDVGILIRDGGGELEEEGVGVVLMGKKVLDSTCHRSYATSRDASAIAW